MDSDWEFSDGVSVAKTTSLRLRIEERTESGLSVGAGIAYLSMRVAEEGSSQSTKFEAENLQIYLRQIFTITESFSFEGLMSYGYYTGRENVIEDRDQIEWSQVDVEFGASIRTSNLRITPFASYSSVDGDISGTDAGGTFELEDPFSYGVRFDYFVETTAFLSLRLQTGSQTGGYFSFVRRY
jgi:hypothetical protein